MRTSWSAAAAALLFCVAGVGPAYGQQAVRVVDASGDGVPSVRVEAYGRATLLDAAATDANGWAHLNTEGWAAVRRLTLRHLGYQTLVIPIEQFDETRPISMEESAYALDGFSVEVTGDSCRGTDAPEARRLWSEAASTYSQDTGRRPVWAAYRFDAGPVMPRGLHSVTEDGLAARERTVRTNPRSAGAVEAVVRRQGYSWLPPDVRWGVRDLHRAYPALEMWDAYHFVTKTFGDLHTFRIVRRRDEGATIEFCPRGSEGTRLLGTLELDEKQRFTRATWRFVSEDPDEDAGGRVDFLTFFEGKVRRPHLLASKGIFYRHSGRPVPHPDLPRSYYRELFVSTEWRVLPPAR